MAAKRVDKANLVIIRDTREQRPLEFSQATVKDAKLQTGDYSLEHFEDKITIERKSLADLLNTLGGGRKRFMDEIQRMQAYEYAAIVVEASLKEIHKGGWRSKITVASVVGSLLAFSAKYGIHVIFAGDRDITARTVEGLLFQFLRKQYEHLERIKPYLVGG